MTNLQKKKNHDKPFTIPLISITNRLFILSINNNLISYGSLYTLSLYKYMGKLQITPLMFESV